jgi:hypothetical protein
VEVLAKQSNNKLLLLVFEKREGNSQGSRKVTRCSLDYKKTEGSIEIIDETKYGCKV